MCESESGSQFSRANSPKAIQRKEKFVTKARRKKWNWTLFRFLKMFHLSPKRFLYFFFFSLTELDLINHLCPHMRQGVQTKAWVITTRGLEWNHCDTLLHPITWPIEVTWSKVLVRVEGPGKEPQRCTVGGHRLPSLLLFHTVGLLGLKCEHWQTQTCDLYPLGAGVQCWVHLRVECCPDEGALLAVSHRV